MPYIYEMIQSLALFKLVQSHIYEIGNHLPHALFNINIIIPFEKKFWRFLI